MEEESYVRTHPTMSRDTEPREWTFCPFYFEDPMKVLIIRFVVGFFHDDEFTGGL